MMLVVMLVVIVVASGYDGGIVTAVHTRLPPAHLCVIYFIYIHIINVYHIHK